MLVESTAQHASETDNVDNGNFKLGVRLDIDFDGFFAKSDAFACLAQWQATIAENLLGLPPAALRLSRIARGSLDLEFEIDVDSGVSDSQLADAIRREAPRLQELLQRPILEVRVGSEGGSPDCFMGPVQITADQDSRALPMTPETSGNSASTTRGRSRTPEKVPSLASRLPGTPRGSGSGHDGGGPCHHAQLRKCQTIPVAPRFLMEGSYWHQRKGARICELKEEK